MSRFKRVVATTDLSPESYAAVAYAAHITDPGGTLTIVHAAPIVSLATMHHLVPVNDLDALERSVLEDARDQISRWAAAHLGDEPKYEIEIVAGPIDDIIARTAKKLDANVVVIATRARRGLGRALLGSHTDRVVQSAPCPVLVVKPSAAKAAAEKKKKSSPRKAAA